jgi:hypothetical protein
LVCLLDTPFDRCPAGFAYLTGLLLRGCWHLAAIMAVNDATAASPIILLVLMLLVSLNASFSCARYSSMTPNVPSGSLLWR